MGRSHHQGCKKNQNTGVWVVTTAEFWNGCEKQICIRKHRQTTNTHTLAVADARLAQTNTAILISVTGRSAGAVTFCSVIVKTPAVLWEWHTANRPSASYWHSANTPFSFSHSVCVPDSHTHTHSHTDPCLSSCILMTPSRAPSCGHFQPWWLSKMSVLITFN